MSEEENQAQAIRDQMGPVVEEGTFDLLTEVKDQGDEPPVLELAISFGGREPDWVYGLDADSVDVLTSELLRAAAELRTVTAVWESKQATGRS